MDLNNVNIIGRLVRDPEIRYTQNGTAMARISIANNSIENKKEYVNYFDVNVWGKQAENCNQYLKKGSQVAISGTLRQNRWTDQTGQNRYKIEINANIVQFLSHAKKEEKNETFNDPWKDQQEQPF